MLYLVDSVHKNNSLGVHKIKYKVIFHEIFLVDLFVFVYLIKNALMSFF